MSAERLWSQMLPSEHLDAADALTIEARSRVPAEAVALRREAELHLLAAQVQAIRLQTPAPQLPREAVTSMATRRASVMQLERDALQDQMAEDMAAIRDHARATRYRT